MSDKRLVMILAAENNALNAEIAALKDALDKATKGEYSKLMLDLAAGRAGQIADRLENAKLKAENAALKKEAVIAEKYGLSQAAEICRDAALVHPINGYERGYNDACRDNYNAILKVKDKP